MTLTVYILASRKEQRYVKELWLHTSLMRRQLHGISWVSPLYVEDIPQSNALVEMPPKPYVALGCLSNTFVAACLDQPALREMIDGAMRKVPVLISHCIWNEPPCPFADKQAAWHQTVTSAANRDDVLYKIAERMRGMLMEILKQIK
jgi:hypothetical protein